MNIELWIFAHTVMHNLGLTMYAAAAYVLMAAIAGGTGIWAWRKYCTND